MVPSAMTVITNSSATLPMQQQQSLHRHHLSSSATLPLTATCPWSDDGPSVTVLPFNRSKLPFLSLFLYSFSLFFPFLSFRSLDRFFTLSILSFSIVLLSLSNPSQTLSAPVLTCSFPFFRHSSNACSDCLSKGERLRNAGNDSNACLCIVI